MFPACSLHVPCMFPDCSLNVPLHVPFMFPSYEGSTERTYQMVFLNAFKKKSTYNGCSLTS
jgi:hypothetical protein